MSHFLTFEPSRKGQLGAYIAALARGTDALQAARIAFGDLKKLERDLNAYLNRSKLQYLKISGAAVNVAPVEVTKLSAGGGAVMPLLIELRNREHRNSGVDYKLLSEQIRMVQARYPGDPLVETTLAAAEVRAGQFAAANAAADRALKADPRSADAMILKGRALMGLAMETDDATPAQFSAARQWFSNANKIDAEDPEPLMEFYKSYLDASTRPTANAIAALHYASDLAPQDQSLRLNSALQYIRDGKLADARATLVPIAYNPHGQGLARAARGMIARIDAGDAEGAEKAAFEDSR